jgi:PII-like signaling protein
MNRAAELTVVVGERDHHHHVPLYTEIVRRAHRRGLAGASVFRGADATARQVQIVIVDAESRVRAFLPEVRELSGEHGVVTVRDVEVLSTLLGRR